MDSILAQIYQDFEECERKRWLRDRSSIPYSMFDSFLFKDKTLGMPISSWRELFVRETYGGGLMDHFGVE